MSYLLSWDHIAWGRSRGMRHAEDVSWLRRSIGSGAAPSFVKIWVDGAALPLGTYDGWIKVWAKGATNSPWTIAVHVIR